jgi:hypothetical protein
MNEEYIYKIKHIPTGLFYCSRKGSGRKGVTNLSNKGNFYEDVKRAEKVLKQDVDRAFINRAQAERYNLQINLPNGAFYGNCWGLAKKEDFIIVKYVLTQIIDILY